MRSGRALSVRLSPLDRGIIESLDLTTNADEGSNDVLGATNASTELWAQRNHIEGVRAAHITKETLQPPEDESFIGSVMVTVNQSDLLV